MVKPSLTLPQTLHSFSKIALPAISEARKLRFAASCVASNKFSTYQLTPYAALICLTNSFQAKDILLQKPCSYFNSLLIFLASQILPDKLDKVVLKDRFNMLLLFSWKLEWRWRIQEQNGNFRVVFVLTLFYEVSKLQKFLECYQKPYSGLIFKIIEKSFRLLFFCFFLVVNFDFNFGNVILCFNSPEKVSFELPDRLLYLGSFNECFPEYIEVLCLFVFYYCK